MKVDPHLVPAFPVQFSDLECPSCGKGSPVPIGLAVPGSNVLGAYRCDNCGYRFYRDLPVGFAIDHAIALGMDDGRTFYQGDYVHFTMDPIAKGSRKKNMAPVQVERRVERRYDRVILLNTLDHLYGHVLLKLWNAQHYLDAHPDLGLVVIIPKGFEWLVPEGVAEVWSVELGLSRMLEWHSDLDDTLSGYLKGYEEVYFARGYAHPEKDRIDIARFTGIGPFPLHEFQALPPHITFVMRTDRVWHRWRFEKWAARSLSLFGSRALRDRIWRIVQDRRMAKCFDRIKKEVPALTASIVGLGAPGRTYHGMEDLRSPNMDVERERSWCETYARSHVVIGIHGSNMLLPTAHAAGCVEILPYDRYRNLGQDLAVRNNDIMQLFLYRFVDEYASPIQVARHVVSILKDHAAYSRNNIKNVFGHE
ncbi:MAG: hypothetical protein KDB88_05275 [Flavobacteriales bacterium]|nr:hypothetical protein [Flavobacteriales bacterium]